MRRVLCAMAAALSVAPAAARAEGFTFTGTGQVTAQVSQTSSGRLVTTTYTTVGSELTAAGDGRKSSMGGTCVTRSHPGSRGTTVATGECQLTEGGAAFKAAYTCITTNAEKTASQCSGNLLGYTGKYQGRAGTMTWQSALSADRRSEATSGSGNWVEG